MFITYMNSLAELHLSPASSIILYAGDIYFIVLPAKGAMAPFSSKTQISFLIGLHPQNLPSILQRAPS